MILSTENPRLPISASLNPAERFGLPTWKFGEKSAVAGCPPAQHESNERTDMNASPVGPAKNNPYHSGLKLGIVVGEYENVTPVLFDARASTL